MQAATDVGDLDQPRGGTHLTKRVEQNAGVEGVARGQPPGAACAHRAGADGVLQAKLLARERARRGSVSASLLESARHVADRGEVGLKLPVVDGPHRRNRQCGGPPALTPAEQEPWPSRPKGVPLRQFGEFGAACGGLRPQLRRAEGDPVLFKQV